jgi:hypothetical protein
VLSLKDSSANFMMAESPHPLPKKTCLINTSPGADSFCTHVSLLEYLLFKGFIF